MPSQLSPLDDPTMDRLVTAVAARLGLQSAAKWETVRWIVGLVLAGLISYLTTVGTMEKEIAEVRATEDAHFQEVLRRLDILQADIRELRSR